MHKNFKWIEYGITWLNHFKHQFIDNLVKIERIFHTQIRKVICSFDFFSEFSSIFFHCLSFIVRNLFSGLFEMLPIEWIEFVNVFISLSLFFASFVFSEFHKNRFWNTMYSDWAHFLSLSFIVSALNEDKWGAIIIYVYYIALIWFGLYIKTKFEFYASSFFFFLSFRVMPYAICMYCSHIDLYKWLLELLNTDKAKRWKKKCSYRIHGLRELLLFLICWIRHNIQLNET